MFIKPAWPGTEADTHAWMPTGSAHCSEWQPKQLLPAWAKVAANIMQDDDTAH